MNFYYSTAGFGIINHFPNAVVDLQVYVKYYQTSSVVASFIIITIVLGHVRLTLRIVYTTSGVPV